MLIYIILKVKRLINFINNIMIEFYTLLINELLKQSFCYHNILNLK